MTIIDAIRTGIAENNLRVLDAAVLTCRNQGLRYPDILALAQRAVPGLEPNAWEALMEELDGLDSTDDAP